MVGRRCHFLASQTHGPMPSTSLGINELCEFSDCPWRFQVWRTSCSFWIVTVPSVLWGAREAYESDRPV